MYVCLDESYKSDWSLYCKETSNKLEFLNT